MATAAISTQATISPGKQFGLSDLGESPYKAALAAFLVRQQLEHDLARIDPSNLLKEHAVVNPSDKKSLPRRPDACDTNEDHIAPKNVTVGIIGAGIAGLYAGYMLDHIGVPYEILEASDRVGGRLYTHHFSDKTHDYYDIGAMRFPKTPVMRRTFDLFERTKLELGVYIMESEKQPTRYNDRNAVGPLDKLDDPFHVSTTNGGNVPPESLKNPGLILDDAFDRFRRKIKRAIQDQNPDDIHASWKYLMNHDRFSLRDYLSFVEGYDYETIHWLETQFSATGWFDEAFTENVLESLAFEWVNNTDKDGKKDLKEEEAVKFEDIVWHFIEGGTSKLTDAMVKLINDAKPGEESRIKMKKRVTAIGIDKAKQEALEAKQEALKAKQEALKAKQGALDASAPGATDIDQNIVQVKVAGEAKPRYYATVINTTTLAALQKIDLLGLQLPYAMKSAIRSLRYDPSTKVAIKFETPWWVEEYDIKGGLGKTDMPLRTCVYPSYNINDKGNAVLLCSYTWGQDSERISAMVPSGEYKDEEKKAMEEELKETMLSNLARLHVIDDDKDETKYKALLAKITKQCIAIHGYDWSKDPYTCGGAFALFSPGQFSKLYPPLVRPAADSRFHIVGEAASAHHAWIVGALDSAFRGVWAFLERFHMHDLQHDLQHKYHFGTAHEMAETHLQVAFGRLQPKEQPVPIKSAAAVATVAA